MKHFAFALWVLRHGTSRTEQTDRQRDNNYTLIDITVTAVLACTAPPVSLRSMYFVHTMHWRRHSFRTSNKQRLLSKQNRFIISYEGINKFPFRKKKNTICELVNKANLVHNFLSVFISVSLYMYRATMRPSSWEITVSMRHLAFVTLCTKLALFKNLMCIGPCFVVTTEE